MDQATGKKHEELLKAQREIAHGLCLHPADTYAGYMLKVGAWQGLQTAMDTLKKGEADD